MRWLDLQSDIAQSELYGLVGVMLVLGGGGGNADKRVQAKINIFGLGLWELGNWTLRSMRSNINSDTSSMIQMDNRAPLLVFVAAF